MYEYMSMRLQEGYYCWKFGPAGLFVYSLPFCQKRVSRRDAELISLQLKLTKFRLLILVRKIHILAKK